MNLLGKPAEKITLPVVPVREGVVFPLTENVLVFGRQKSILAIQESLKKDKKFLLVMQKNASIENPGKNDIYQTGVIVLVEKIVTGEKGEINALVKGVQKAVISEFISEEPFFQASVSLVQDMLIDSDEIQAMVRYISAQIKRAVNLGKAMDFVFLMNILNSGSVMNFANQIAMILDMKETERQELLEMNDAKKRLSREVELINREIKILEIEQNISSKTQKKFEKGMRETLLKEKMKTIEEELGGGEDKEFKEYREKIRKAEMPKEVEEKALKELKRLVQMSQFNPEASYVKTYLDWLIELPWKSTSMGNVDILQSERILNEDHFGLKKIKERILEYLAVMQLRGAQKAVKTKKNFQPTIICFVGPPGVGKTSLGKSIARSLGRKFVKMSLGGIRDEAEIRGHRRTYVGALPGRIIQGIKQAGSNNPVFMLDEIDKIGRDYRGDPSSALLEALDPEQNNAFSDHYLELPYDLSNVFFITTANILDTIPEALLDRLEVIHFPGYTEDEKFHIARDFLIKKELDAHALSPQTTTITDSAIKFIIERYTREAGVRNLTRQFATIFRKVARETVEKKKIKHGIGHTQVAKYLGPHKFSPIMAEEKDSVGISTGLFWTQAGGGILFIEVAIMPGKGTLILTGQLGDVMKESCQAALTYIRARWERFKLAKDFFATIDIHIHVPEGAVPKDGPSAGIAITTAMISALTKSSVRRNVGMTGEVTLRGRVLEIGGVKEKVIGAHRARISDVIIPFENKKDVEDIPPNVLKDLRLHYVKHMDEVLHIALSQTQLSKSKKKSSK